MCINIWMFVSLCLYLSVCVLCLRECSSASCLVLFLRLPVIFVLPLTLTSPKWHVRTPLSTKVCTPKLSPVYVYSFAQFTQGSLGIEMLVTRLKSQKRQCRQLYADRYISLQILCIVQIKYSNKCWSQIHHTLIPFISMYSPLICILLITSNTENSMHIDVHQVLNSILPTVNVYAHNRSHSLIALNVLKHCYAEEAFLNGVYIQSRFCILLSDLGFPGQTWISLLISSHSGYDSWPSQPLHNTFTIRTHSHLHTHLCFIAGSIRSWLFREACLWADKSSK